MSWGPDIGTPFLLEKVVSESFTVSDTDAIRPSIVQATLNPVIPVLPAVDTVVVQVGNNLWTGTAFKFVIERALQQIFDVLRENQYPEGAGLVNFAYLAVVDQNGSLKNDVVVGDGALHPVLTEDVVIVEYRWAASGAGANSGGTSNTGAGGAGSSTNRRGQLERIRQYIREELAASAA